MIFRAVSLGECTPSLSSRHQKAKWANETKDETRKFLPHGVKSSGLTDFRAAGGGVELVYLQSPHVR